MFTGPLVSHFGFKNGIWLLIVAVPVHCFSVTFSYVPTTAHCGGGGGGGYTVSLAANFLLSKISQLLDFPS